MHHDKIGCTSPTWHAPLLPDLVHHQQLQHQVMETRCDGADFQKTSLPRVL